MRARSDSETLALGFAEKGCAGLRRPAGADIPSSSAITRELLGWVPTHPGLIADLELGHFFSSIAGDMPH